MCNHTPGAAQAAGINQAFYRPGHSNPAIFTGNRCRIKNQFPYFTSKRCRVALVMMVFPSSYVMSIVWTAFKPVSCSHLLHSCMMGKGTRVRFSRSKGLLQTVIRLVFQGTHSELFMRQSNAGVVIYGTGTGCTLRGGPRENDCNYR